MQIKTTVRSHLTPLAKLESRQTIPSVGEDVENLEFSCLAKEIIQQDSSIEKLFGSSSKC
jgi:hypothetical protein